MRRILILGAGYIGRRIQQETGYVICDQKISSYQDLLAIVKKYKPHTLINCAGYVGKNNIDDCEKAIDECLLANTFLPIWLGELACRTKIKVVHISSGCIYHYRYTKDKPIREGKKPDYNDLFYSRSKIYADQVLEHLTKSFNILILRIRVPLDIYPHPRNLLTKLIKYKKVISEPNSVTYIPDFIKALEHLLKIKAKGTFNVAVKGGLRYKQLLEAYQLHVPGFKFTKTSLKKLGLARTSLVLSTKKLEKTGFAVRGPEDILNECVGKYLRV